MALTSLQYVILLCADIERMRHSYHEILGFPIYSDGGDGANRWIEMRVGSGSLTLRLRGRPYDGQDMPGSAIIQLAFRVTPPDVYTCHSDEIPALDHPAIVQGLALHDRHYGTVDELPIGEASEADGLNMVRKGVSYRGQPGEAA